MIYTLRIYLWTGNTSDNEFTEDTIWTVGFELNFVTKIIDTTFKRMVHTFKRMAYELIWTSSRKTQTPLAYACGSFFAVSKPYLQVSDVHNMFEQLPNTEDFREWIFLLALVDFYVSRIILP